VRLYRITGQGLYSDSMKLGLTVPLRKPGLNALVFGQDPTQALSHRGKLSWFWGDTLRAAHPLGHFQMVGATSSLPENGGLDPSVGVDLEYFVDAEGFSRPMAPMQEPGVVWLDGIVTVTSEGGEERLIAHYSRRKDLTTELEHGFMVDDDARDLFVKTRVFDGESHWRHPHGQSVRHDGYLYFANPFATVRVRAAVNVTQNPGAYEAFTWEEADAGKDIQSAFIEQKHRPAH
jgi:hypothetical protein